jgi:hypothetical protein
VQTTHIDPCVLLLSTFDLQFLLRKITGSKVYEETCAPGPRRKKRRRKGVGRREIRGGLTLPVQRLRGSYRRWGASTSGWREIPSGDNTATLLAGEVPCHAQPRAPPSADETLGTRESAGGEGQEKNEMR